MKELEFVACWENIPDSKKEELDKDPDLFLYYCPDSDLTYYLRVMEIEQ